MPPVATNTACDAVIIGAGHNGLVCAFYLARQGLRVRILERRGVVGGAAVTEEFHPGFRNSVAAYTVSLLQPKIIGDMHLHRHGLRIVFRPMENFLPLDDGSCLSLDADLRSKQREVAKFSKRDAEQLPLYFDRLEPIASLFRSLMLKTPPNLGGGLHDVMRAIQDGNLLRKLGLEEQRNLLGLLLGSAGAYLDRFFESDPIKAALGFDSIVGTYASPYTPGTGYVLLHHVTGEVNGRKGAWGHAIGGMGAITQAMAEACKEVGVEITTNAPVEKVLLDENRAMGVVLNNGDKITARSVISNLNPRLLYDRMVDPAAVDAGFLERIRNWKCGSGTFRMNVALSELPDFLCLRGTSQQPHHGSGIILAPSLAYMDRAYDDARRTGWSAKPIVEMVIPSTLDDTLAPNGQHVASLFCQQFAPVLGEGRSWDDIKDQTVNLIMDHVTEYAPNFRSSVLGWSALTPLDLERTFGMLGGDIFHGALSPDQLYSARPMLGYADYRGPLLRLYTCGSGTHPGGGVTGAAGYNAAREVAKDLTRKFAH